MLTILWLIVAAIFKAVADTLQHHFSSSVFKSSNPNFWNPNESWKYARRVFSYPVDAWHLSNSFMIVAFILAAISHHQVIMTWWVECLLDGIVFILVFNFFYNRVFRRT